MNKNLLEQYNKIINIFINNDPLWGGTYQYSELIIKTLETRFSKENIKLHFTTKNNLKPGEHYFLNFNIFQFFLINVLIFFSAKNIAKILAKFKILKLPISFFEKNEMWIFPSQDLVSVLCAGKTIVSINDLMHRYSSFPETSSLIRRSFRDYQFNKIAKYSNIVLVDSKLGKKHVEDCYGVYNNIKVQYFSTQLSETKLVNLDAKKYIIYPSQYWQHKNHVNLLLAINILKRKYKDIKLVLIGHKKRNYNKIFKLTQKLGVEKNIEFLGYVSENNKAKLIANARALINPSFLGPTNIPQIEAFKLSCPVILSNVFAAKEQCGDSAMYFDPNYPESIAASIERIWESDYLYELYSSKSSSRFKNFTQEKFSSDLIRNIF
jgi:glycosyltransferase involved in cell wall biosynthesis